MSDCKKTLHIIGLLSEGGVHSHEQHCLALAAMAVKPLAKPLIEGIGYRNILTSNTLLWHQLPQVLLASPR